jgi:GDP-L-fucose synthase
MILVLGATGFLGKRVCRKLQSRRLPFERSSLSLGCDLRDPAQTERLLSAVKPACILNCAAFVGGIQFGYKFPADIFTNNLLMTINLLKSAAGQGVRRIVNPISNCAYPGKATFFKEDELWDGPLHESVMVYGFVRKASWVGSYAFARQHGLDQVNLILSNMYGPEDHFEPERSHALGALIMKFVEAKRKSLPFVEVWGTGKPVREWLYVDDGAEAMVRAMDIPPFGDPINIGVGRGISIGDLAVLIKELTEYAGAIRFNPDKPDGALYKTVDGTRGERLLGWKPDTDFHEAVRSTVAWYREHHQEDRGDARNQAG